MLETLNDTHSKTCTRALLWALEIRSGEKVAGGRAFLDSLSHHIIHYSVRKFVLSCNVHLQFSFSIFPHQTRIFGLVASKLCPSTHLRVVVHLDSQATLAIRIKVSEVFQKLDERVEKPLGM